MLTSGILNIISLISQLVRSKTKESAQIFSCSEKRLLLNKYLNTIDKTDKDKLNKAFIEIMQCNSKTDAISLSKFLEYPKCQTLKKKKKLKL